MPTLILTRRDTRKLLTMKDVLRVVEQGFRDWTEGKGIMPPKAYLQVKEGDFRAMPASLPGVSGIKWVNVHAGNPAKSLPTVMAVLICNDPSTGYPLTIMDATDITAYRTGATSAIASKYLARKNSKTMGVVGAGRQAYTQILAHLEYFSFQKIKVYDISSQVTERLTKLLPDYPLVASSLIDAVQSDIVCTVTTARQPIVKHEWVLPGTHINAVGADAEGKQELESAVLKVARVVVDDVRQAAKAGEINVPIAKGLYSQHEVYGTLGELVAGKKKGRIDDREITIFDSTGVAIEDIAVAHLLYTSAREKGIGLTVNLVDE
ncbi:MAG TPA: ornithine cyclodeaminase family protein [Dehalococcoidales bacterium]